ncbi:MAG: GIY-YIG nuclease family protein [Patescibacteria group bacterium]
MFYTYVLKSDKYDKLYIGYTSDLKRRSVEHNQGLNLSTKRYRPWKIIYYEACLNKKDAERREKYLKTTQGGRLLKRRLKEFYYEEKSKDLIN